MGVTAIVCEYHPFHYGHQKQIDLIRQSDPDGIVLSLMSGNFVQRGEPALFDAYTRAEAAVACGSDIVLLLPMPYSMSGGKYFADAAVEILQALGAVDRICFGSEDANLPHLQTVAERLESADYQAAYSKARAQSELPPARLATVLYREQYREDLPSKPNAILAVEYLRAIKRKGSTITPFLIHRTGNESATAARRAIRAGDSDAVARLIPPPALACYDLANTAELSRFALPILAHFRMTSPRENTSAAEMTFDTACKLQKAARSACDLPTLLTVCADASHTDAARRRMLLSSLIGITEEMLKAPPAYTQLLAASERGRAFLRTLHRTSRIPILTKPAHYRNGSAALKAQCELAMRADALYTLAFSKVLPADTFWKAHPRFLPKPVANGEKIPFEN